MNYYYKNKEERLNYYHVNKELRIAYQKNYNANKKLEIKEYNRMYHLKKKEQYKQEMINRLPCRDKAAASFAASFAACKEPNKNKPPKTESILTIVKGVFNIHIYE